MNKSQLGNLFQLKVMTRLTELGYSVLLPIGDGEKVDLIFIEEGKLARAQIKHGRLRNGAVVFNCYTQTRSGNRILYTGEIDVFLVYCKELNKVFRVPIEHTGVNTVSLRVDESERRYTRIKYGKDFEI